MKSRVPSSGSMIHTRSRREPGVAVGSLFAEDRVGRECGAYHCENRLVRFAVRLCDR